MRWVTQEVNLSFKSSAPGHDVGLPRRKEDAFHVALNSRRTKEVGL